MSRTGKYLMWFAAQHLAFAASLASACTACSPAETPQPGPAAPAAVTDIEPVWPSPEWPISTPAEMNMDEQRLEQARDHALAGGGSGMIIRSGKLVYSWGDPAQLYDLKSTTKSIGVTALGLAIQDQRLALGDAARLHLPDVGVPPASNALTGWLEDLSLLHLATHSAGFDKVGGFTALLFEPGTAWSYSDGGPNWLADILTVKFGADLAELLTSRVFGPIGIEPRELSWRDNNYRTDAISGLKRREFGSGIDASVDAMARIGYLYLRRGEWNGQRILPEAFVDTLARPSPAIAGLPVREPDAHPNASAHYGLLWWNNGDGSLAGVPMDAYWSWGLQDSLIVVVPSLDLVVARAGDGWRPDWDSDYSVLEPFLRPIAESVAGGHAVTTPAGTTPYPPSTLIKGIAWAPAESIARAAPGSDTWPITWGDDDSLYTAFGDGWGFDEPRGKENKLSAGYARVTGPATAFAGFDIPSTGEQKGDGPRGKKVSGMLMVDGVLYQWVRNANNAGEQCQLAWSTDRAASWQWSEWTFAELGYCAFLNFGQNYAGARDSFVYMYSPDIPSAYVETDAAVLTRVPKDRMAQRDAYEFFAGVDSAGEPVWSTAIDDRQPVFSFPGAVNRLDVTYNAPLGRYLMTLRSGGVGPRDGGLDHFSIFEAPEPWGPWSTVFHIDHPASEIDWGEAQHIPGKWISEDGREFHLVFSGDDSFSVRQAVLTVAVDTTAPLVNIVAPSDGEQTSGTVTITVDAGDDNAVESVAFAANGSALGTDETAPYEMSWDTSGLAAGDYELTATAIDASDNHATDTVIITVDVPEETAPASDEPEELSEPESTGGGGSTDLLTALLVMSLILRRLSNRRVTREPALTRR